MAKPTPDRWFVFGVCSGLIALVWFVFGQTVTFPFVNYDDPQYVYEVPEINAGLTWHGLKWAFTHWPSTNWFPLKNISHMLEFQFFGFNPGAFHLTNVILHMVAAVLLFLFLRNAMTAPNQPSPVWKCAFVAAVFAIHPLRVESVVWVEERKDVLSGVFFMLTLLAYARYTRKQSVGRFITVLMLFACGLLSKPMLVTMPFILLLLDYWPLGRFSRGGRFWPILLEKIPLFALAAAVATLTSVGIAPIHSASDHVPLFPRIANALVSYCTYIWQMIWPAKLAIFYPHPQDQLPIWQAALAIVMLVAMTAAVLVLRKTRPYLLVGWAWYVLMLAPVIGLIQINLQAHADRYTYLPQIGLYILIAWSVAEFASKFPRTRPIIAVVTITAIITLTAAARVQASYWQDSEKLWNHTIAVTKGNYFAHASLADLLMRRDRVREAIEHSEEALRIRPDDADAQNNLGLALLRLGDINGAVRHLSKALEVNPGHMNAEVNLAWILATAPNPAMRNGPKAVALASDVAQRTGHPNAIVLRTLAAAYAENGQFSEAVAVAEQAIEIAKAIGNDALATDLQANIASYRLSQPLRAVP